MKCEVCNREMRSIDAVLVCPNGHTITNTIQANEDEEFGAVGKRKKIKKTQIKREIITKRTRDNKALLKLNYKIWKEMQKHFEVKEEKFFKYFTGIFEIESAKKNMIVNIPKRAEEDDCSAESEEWGNNNSIRNLKATGKPKSRKHIPTEKSKTPEQFTVKWKTECMNILDNIFNKKLYTRYEDHTSFNEYQSANFDQWSINNVPVTSKPKITKDTIVTRDSRMSYSDLVAVMYLTKRYEVEMSGGSYTYSEYIEKLNKFNSKVIIHRLTNNSEERFDSGRHSTSTLLVTLNNKLKLLGKRGFYNRSKLGAKYESGTSLIGGKSETGVLNDYDERLKCNFRREFHLSYDLGVRYLVKLMEEYGLFKDQQNLDPVDNSNQPEPINYAHCLKYFKKFLAIINDGSLVIPELECAIYLSIYLGIYHKSLTADFVVGFAKRNGIGKKSFVLLIDEKRILMDNSINYNEYCNFAYKRVAKWPFDNFDKAMEVIRKKVEIFLQKEKETEE